MPQFTEEDIDNVSGLFSDAAQHLRDEITLSKMGNNPVHSSREEWNAGRAAYLEHLRKRVLAALAIFTCTRDQFEEWAAGHGFNLARLSGSDDYESIDTAAAWLAWQTRHPANP